MRQAWQTTRGAGQIVAVVETGLDYSHPDIAANVWVNPGEDSIRNGVVDDSDWNGVDDDANGLVDDLRGYDFAGFGAPLSDGTLSRGDPDPFDPLGHGTHVSGTIAAVADNGIGIAGVAPEARGMALKGFDDEGNGRASDLWAAVLYAIENGAGVINASWSCSPACPDNPLARQVLAVAADAGVVSVTSAGNEAVDVVRTEPERTTATVSSGLMSAMGPHKSSASSYRVSCSYRALESIQERLCAFRSDWSALAIEGLVGASAWRPYRASHLRL